MAFTELNSLEHFFIKQLSGIIFAIGEYSLLEYGILEK